MTQQVFLSYRRDDAEGHARALHEFLGQRFAPGTIFFDSDRIAISEGDVFMNRIQSALDQAEVVLVLIGKRWLKAIDAQGRQRLHLPEDIVRQEIETALQLGKLVLTVLLDGAECPRAEHLPPSMQALTRRESFRFGGKTDEFQRERDRLAKYLGQQPKLSPARPKHQLKLPHERQLLEIQRHYLGRGQTKPAFVGREQQLRELDDWLADDKAAPRLLLTGAAAMGKSSLILHWLQDPQADKLGWAVVFLPISVRFGTNTPDVFWSMAAARMAGLAKLSFEAPRTQLADVYLDICLDALEQLEQQGRKLLFVMDGLDELADWEIAPALLNCAHASMRWLVSARAVGAQTQAVAHWLQTLGWRRGHTAQVMELLALNRAAVMQAVSDCLANSDDAPSALNLAEDVWRSSAGDPMLLGYYLDDLATLPHANLASARQTLAGIEPGFASFFNSWVKSQRPFWKDKSGDSDLLNDLLLLLCCAKGPVPIAGIEYLLTSAFDLITPLSAARLLGLQRFVIETADGLVLAHPRLKDHLLLGFPEEGRQVQRARQAYLRWGRNALSRALGERYLARYYALHLADLKSKAQPSDFMHLVTVPWVQLSLREDDSGRQLALDLEIARRELVARAGASDPLQAWLWSIMLMRASIQTRARVQPELLATFVQHGLLSREHALRRLELMPPRERACGLALLAKGVPAPDREPLIAQALQAVPAIRDFSEKMTHWAAVLANLPQGPEREQAEETLLQALDEAGTMYHWLQAVDLIAPSLTLRGQETLLRWCFSRVDSSEEWDRLDALMPHLQAPLHDQAVALAIRGSSALAAGQAEPPGQQQAANASRATRIADAALPYVFPCLTPAERAGCWQRVHATTQQAKRESFRIYGLSLVWPWLQASGREEEVRTQLKYFHAHYTNEYAKAEMLSRFARVTAEHDVAELARELLVATLLKMRTGDSLHVKYLGQAADVLNDAAVNRCFEQVLVSPAPGRWQAVASLAARLSTPQLQQVRTLQGQLGDQADARLTLCALRLQQGADANADGWTQDLAALRHADPDVAQTGLLKQIDATRWDEVFGAQLSGLAGGVDALLLARPGAAPPAELWAAIQRQRYQGARVFAILEQRQLLRVVMPDSELLHALELLVDDGHYQEVLHAMDDLPSEMVLALYIRMSDAIKRGPRKHIKHFPGACLLAVAGPQSERAGWKAWVLDTLQDEDIDDPQYLVGALPLCTPQRREAQLGAILELCAAYWDSGLDAMLLLMPQLSANESPPFIEHWLRGLRKKCAEQADWLTSIGPVPGPFQQATLNALEELLEQADRSTMLRTMTRWAPAIADHLDAQSLAALISGVRTAADAFE